MSALSLELTYTGYTEMKCTDCKYCYLQDYGYSNWTVEGTNFSCLRKAHPEGCFDRFYGENPKLNYAENCEVFQKGKGLFVDVEGSAENCTTDPEIMKLYKELQVLD